MVLVNELQAHSTDGQEAIRDNGIIQDWVGSVLHLWSRESMLEDLEEGYLPPGTEASGKRDGLRMDQRSEGR